MAVTAQRMPNEVPGQQIELRGVRVHNLKNIDLDIPLHCLVVLCGVSGSGKSSLAFETLFAEGQRRYIESFSVAARQHLERVERPNADRIAHVPVAIAIRSERSRQARSDSRATMATVAELLDGLRLLFARVGRIICPTCGREIRQQSAVDVVNVIAKLPAGTRCQISFTPGGDKEKASAWLARGFSRAIWGGVTHELTAKATWPHDSEVSIVADRLVAGTATSERILESAETALGEGAGRCRVLFAAVDDTSGNTCTIDGRNWRFVPINRRLECTNCSRSFLPIEPRLFSHMSAGACLVCKGTGRELNGAAGNSECVACGGTRFRAEALAVRIANRSIADFCGTSPSGILSLLQELNGSLGLEDLRRTERVRADIVQRLNTVRELGLDYLTLDRSAETLSGGEQRRLTLAAVIGSRITGTLVVVDEPSAGLSIRELPYVVTALRRVLELRNSVIAVDHAPFLVSNADHVIELGPEAGPGGGHIVYQGPPMPAAAIRNQLPDESPTSRNSQRVTLSTCRPASGSKARRKGKPIDVDQLSLTRIRHHNLDDVQIAFPLRQLCVVTGPSGSGKSSLVVQTLFPAVCRRLEISYDVACVGLCELSGGESLVDAVLVDQSPLTRSARSNPATWLEVFDEIRQTFATTIDARQRGFSRQQFSFNSSRGGRCRSCLGTGLLKQDMQFLPDVTLCCPECGGSRYRPEILDVKYRGRSIADVLAMTVSEAANFFRSQPRLQNRFQMLKQIGLDYLVLGQPSETLSGGEAQRLKLAARISAPNRGPCLIVCDEPTTGLHPKDVGRLVTCFRELIANGHSIVVADNSPEFSSSADFVVELVDG